VAVGIGLTSPRHPLGSEIIRVCGRLDTSLKSSVSSVIPMPFRTAARQAPTIAARDGLFPGQASPVAKASKPFFLCVLN
jgi:hypothetical protein